MAVFLPWADRSDAIAEAHQAKRRREQHGSEREIDDVHEGCFTVARGE